MAMKQIWWFTTLIFSLVICTPVFGQQDSIPTSNQFKGVVSGVVDFFYGYDFNQPEGKTRLPFLCNHNRHNQLALNLGLIKIAMTKGQFRSNVALHAGAYSVDNYADEPGILKHVFEANAGVLLSKKGMYG